MFNRLNRYLLTNYPLIWNTRVIPLVLACLVIHLLFFAVGYGQITAGTIQHFYSTRSVGGSSLYTLSILISMAVILIWLVMYLRNNAFKNFYVIDKWFLAKQFIVLCICLYVSTAFFHTFHWGVNARTRSITSQAELVKETNILNLASRFLPYSKSDYFKLNTCGSGDKQIRLNSDYNYYDTSLAAYNDSQNRVIRSVLKDPDAFLYRNYCAGEVQLDTYNGFRKMDEQRKLGNSWIDGHLQDSIRSVIEQAVLIARKYKVESRIHPDALAKAVFADSAGVVKETIALLNPDDNYAANGNYTDADTYVSNARERHKPGTDYLNMSELRSVMYFIERSHLNESSSDTEMEFQTVLLYVVICMAIILFSYRLFTRRVFLFSVVGTIVWSIFFFMFMSGYRSEISSFYFLLFLCFASLALSFPLPFSKTWRGLLLNWHVWLVPFVVMMIVHLIREDYNSHFNEIPMLYNNGVPGPVPPGYTDAERAARYPIGHWVDGHLELLIRLNLALVMLYVSLVFTRLARRWHISPDE